MKEEEDYKSFYVLGLSFIILGIILSAIISLVFIGFLGIGVVFLAISLKNKDKWKKK